MKPTSIVAALLCAGSLFAQGAADRSLDGRIQLFGEFIQPRDCSVDFGNGDSQVVRAKTQTGIGLRFLGSMGADTNWFYELGGRLDSYSQMEARSTVDNMGANYNPGDIRFSWSYWSLGVGYMKELGPMTLGAHLEGRGEALNVTGHYLADGFQPLRWEQGNTYLRPWVRLSVDVTLGSGKVRPYLGIDASMAILRTSQSGQPEFDDCALRTMAPNWSAAVYAGVRF